MTKSFPSLAHSGLVLRLLVLWARCPGLLSSRPIKRRESSQCHSVSNLFINYITKYIPVIYWPFLRGFWSGLVLALKKPCCFVAGKKKHHHPELSLPVFCFPRIWTGFDLWNCSELYLRTTFSAELGFSKKTL